MFFGMCNSPAMVPGYDGLHFLWHDQRVYGDCLHGQHSYPCQDTGRTRMIHKDSTSIATRKWSISKAKEMQIQQDNNGISRANHQGRTTINGPSQTRRNQQLASTNYSQTSQSLSRIWKLLLMLHIKILWTSPSTKWLVEKGHTMPACQESFDTLKKWFTKEPVLMMPDHSQPFQIESDASKYTSGAVLTQMDSNRDRHPIAFMSKTFNDTEKQYKIYDQELLGIIWALKEWWHWIQGSGHMMMVHTDHENLTYFWKAQKPSMMVSFLIWIQHQITTFTRTQNDTIWCIILKTISLSRRRWKWRSNTFTRLIISKPTQPHPTRQDCQCKGLWLRCHKCYCNTIGRRT